MTVRMRFYLLKISKCGIPSSIRGSSRRLILKREFKWSPVIAVLLPAWELARCAPVALERIRKVQLKRVRVLLMGNTPKPDVDSGNVTQGSTSRGAGAIPSQCAVAVIPTNATCGVWRCMKRSTGMYLPSMSVIAVRCAQTARRRSSRAIEPMPQCVGSVGMANHTVWTVVRVWRMRPTVSDPCP